MASISSNYEKMSEWKGMDFVIMTSFSDNLSAFESAQREFNF